MRVAWSSDQMQVIERPLHRRMRRGTVVGAFPASATRPHEEIDD
jgi:hypothetical protein